MGDYIVPYHELLAALGFYMTCCRHVESKVKIASGERYCEGKKSSHFFLPSLAFPTI